MFKKVILLIIILVNISSIFSFSLESGEISQSRTYKLTDFVIQEGGKLTDKYIRLDHVNHDKLHYFIRKSGHFFEYMLLAIFIVTAIGGDRKGLFKASIIAILLCAAFACIDEWVQTFIVGRTGRIEDVLIDSSGALTGIFIYNFVFVKLAALKNNYKRFSSRNT